MQSINLDDYQYNLPEERIAKFPLPDRNASKLLVSRSGTIQHDTFHNLGRHLPQHSTLFFNDSKVIPARILFTKETGAAIEVFVLGPVDMEMAQAFARRAYSKWKCKIRNLKKWKADTVLATTVNGNRIEAELVDRDQQIVQFRYGEELTFSEVLETAGHVPLPPYLKRDPEPEDKERYQTVYSRIQGAVAAPTAGLHFTPSQISSLSEKGFKTDFFTLHVSAGTFQPISVKDAREHPMHTEKVEISLDNIKNIQESGKKIAVGTTSVRTLESLFWYGVKLHQDPEADFRIGRFPYEELPQDITFETSLNAVKTSMEKKRITSLLGDTQIFITPGYQFRSVDGLITNFHLPGSTLILLIAAFIGPHWKNVYNEAISNDYRFLSYGDSSLLFP